MKHLAISAVKLDFPVPPRPIVTKVFIFKTTSSLCCFLKQKLAYIVYGFNCSYILVFKRGFSKHICLDYFLVKGHEREQGQPVFVCEALNGFFLDVVHYPVADQVELFHSGCLS